MRLSVVGIAYMQERFARSALDSITAQTVSDFELIIIDDGSADRTPEIVREWLDETGREAVFVPHQRNAGIAACVEEARLLARGEWVAGLALDDIWHPNRLEKHLEAIRRAGPEVAVVYSDAAAVDGEGNPIADSLIRWRFGVTHPPSGELFTALAGHPCFIPALTATYRRAAVDAIGGFDASLSFEDWDTLLRLAERYQIVYEPAVLGDYRVHPASITSNWGPMEDESMARVMLRHLGKQPDADLVMVPLLAAAAERLYTSGHPRGAYYLRRAARAKRTSRAYLKAALATARLPAPILPRLRNVDSRARAALRIGR